MSKPQSKFPRKLALKVARLAAQNKIAELKIELIKLIEASGTKRGTWGDNANKILQWLNGERDAPFTLFVKGNAKLPFYAFSALPLVTCPGKGECAKWCYSLKAWRCPAAFFRQLQNTILVKSQSTVLAQAFKNLPDNTDVRLYVDGDIDSLETMNYWFDLMNARKDLNVYGYSKSWELFSDFKKLGKSFPKNYTLNLSSGSKYENGRHSLLINTMDNLPVTRGTFSAVKSAKGDKTRQTAIANGLKNVFVCPGKCGECVKSKGKNIHACGSKLFKNVNIVIEAH